MIDIFFVEFWVAWTEERGSVWKNINDNGLQK